ncbi:MAG: 4Fe-4S dicluster domain-containing protein [Thermoplasmatota archaeon]
MIVVLEDWCKGCEVCIKRCPVSALEASKKMNKRGVYPPKLKEVNNCNFCRLCELLCPDFALAVIPEERKERAKKPGLIIGGNVNEV